MGYFVKYIIKCSAYDCELAGCRSGFFKSYDPCTGRVYFAKDRDLARSWKTKEAAISYARHVMNESDMRHFSVLELRY